MGVLNGHSAFWKRLAERIYIQNEADGMTLNMAMYEANGAKNDGLQFHGYSPTVLAFGKPRRTWSSVLKDIEDVEPAGGVDEPYRLFFRVAQLREKCAAEFHKRASEQTLKGVYQYNRPRTLKELKPGMFVDYKHDEKRQGVYKKGGQW